MGQFTYGDLYGKTMTTREESVPEAIEQESLSTENLGRVDPKKKSNIIMGILAIVAILFLLGAF